MEIIKKYWYILLAVIVIVMICVISFKDSSNLKVQDIIKQQDTIIIDVRTKAEYNKGHIEGAINIPYDEINKIEYSLDDNIVVYCQSGNRSKTAYKTLQKMGYKNIYDYGSINNWKQELVKEEENA